MWALQPAQCKLSALLLDIHLPAGYATIEEPVALPAWKAAVIFLASLVSFVAIDLAWIALVAGPAFQLVLGDLLR